MERATQRPPRLHGRLGRVGGALLLLTLLSGCVPALMGGAVVGTTLVATDRRTTGMQMEDQSIEFRVASRVRDQFGEQADVSATAYNGAVLLTGSVPTEEMKNGVGELVRGIENVKEVYNRIDVGPRRTLGDSTNDTWITGQVRTRLLATADLASNAFVIHTYRGNVYLMGRVTRTEAAAAAQSAAQVRGVKQVNTVFEYLTPEEARRLLEASGGNKAAEPQAPVSNVTPEPVPAAEPAPAAPSTVEVIPLSR